MAVGHIHAEVLGASVPEGLHALHLGLGRAHGDEGGEAALPEHGHVLRHGHEPVEDAHAAPPADEVDHGRLGHRVHVRRQDGQIQAELPGLVGHADVHDPPGFVMVVGRNQQDVVEGQGGLGHGNPFWARPAYGVPAGRARAIPAPFPCIGPGCAKVVPCAFSPPASAGSP